MSRDLKCGRETKGRSFRSAASDKRDDLDAIARFNGLRVEAHAARISRSIDGDAVSSDSKSRAVR